MLIIRENKMKSYEEILKESEHIPESFDKIKQELEEIVFKEIMKMFPLIEKKTNALAKKYKMKRGTIPLNGFLAHLKKEARSYLPAFRNSFKEMK